jgi:hypothetical protein
LLEKESELTSLSGPWDIHSPDSVLVAFDSGDLGSEIAVMLEEIEVPPGELFEVVSFAHLSTFRARKPGSPVRGDFDIELMGLFGCVQILIHDFPGLLQTKAKGKDILSRCHKQRTSR